ncbi:polysaccharide deacetylase family protein [Cohnella sp.]|uniref:polysaccharide deacetylase family protein n=1 Tax=Cohnella sp. TaxID=1883426 RepID=UPI003566BADD
MHTQNAPSGIKMRSEYGMKSASGNMHALAGGSETTERVLRPISNYELQKKFPNILVLRGSLQKNLIALTFDDGPDRRFTPQVLDVLKKYKVKATFFLMGSRVAGHPDITKRIHQEGHSIGNHTYWHPKLWQESIDRMRWEVTQTDAAIKNVVGYSPKLFRAPYGGLNDQLLAELGKMNFSVIGWSVDSMDWTQIDSAAVKKNVLSNLHPGAIVLMHSGGHWTQDLSGMVQALDELIPRLKKEGAEFVTIPQMFNLPERK